MTPRPYMNVAQLAAVTPWTPKAIARLVARGVLVRGVHYFTLPGTGRRKLIFKWDKIVDLIEGPAAEAAPERERRRDAPDDAEVTATETALERLLLRHAPGETPTPVSPPRRRPARARDRAC